MDCAGGICSPEGVSSSRQRLGLVFKCEVGGGEVPHPLLPCLFHSRFSVPLRSILGGGVGDKE